MPERPNPIPKIALDDIYQSQHETTEILFDIVYTRAHGLFESYYDFWTHSKNTGKEPCYLYPRVYIKRSNEKRHCYIYWAKNLPTKTHQRHSEHIQKPKGQNIYNLGNLLPLFPSWIRHVANDTEIAFAECRELFKHIESRRASLEQIQEIMMKSDHFPDKFA